jgi:hypothetical protein
MTSIRTNTLTGSGLPPLLSYDELVAHYAETVRGLSKTYLPRAYTEQRLWIQSQGQTREGYCRTYGSRRDPATMIGDGGEAIWDADHAYLVALEREVQRRQGLRPRGRA